MAIAARLQQEQSQDRRGSRRRRLSLETSLEGSGDEASVHDISSTGLLLETAAELAPFETLEINLPEAGTTHAVVIWNSGRYYGCEFKEQLSQAVVSAALLRALPGSARSLPAPIAGQGDELRDDLDEYDQDAEQDKAPLSVRLRVILGSAVILWALIIAAATYVARWVTAASG
jgi:hypothetical protein